MKKQAKDGENKRGNEMERHIPFGLLGYPIYGRCCLLNQGSR